jgi:hypothetical protein
MVGAQRIQGLRKNKWNRFVLATSLTVREDMLNRIVTGDESWVHHYQPESKVLQCNGNIPVHLQTKSLRLRAEKVMLTMFWDSRGVLLAKFKNHGQNVNSSSYCEVLLKLQNAIRRKRPD